MSCLAPTQPTLRKSLQPCAVKAYCGKQAKARSQFRKEANFLPKHQTPYSTHSHPTKNSPFMTYLSEQDAQSALSGMYFATSSTMAGWKPPHLLQADSASTAAPCEDIQ